MSDVELHPIVADLSSSFIVKDGRLIMEPDDAKKHLQRVQSVDPGERELVAEHLVALACRFRERAADAAEGSIALLLAFTAAALDGATERVASLFVAAGLGKEAAAIIGTAQPIAAPRAEPTKAAPVKPRRGLR